MDDNYPPISLLRKIWALPSESRMQIMNRSKEAIVVESFISGVKKPFLAHRDVKVIGDDSCETYEEISGVK